MQQYDVVSIYRFLIRQLAERVQRHCVSAESGSTGYPNMVNYLKSTLGTGEWERKWLHVYKWRPTGAMVKSSIDAICDQTKST